MTRIERPDARYLPGTADVLFAPGQPRAWRYFQRDASAKAVGFADGREGEDITWRLD